MSSKRTPPGPTDRRSTGRRDDGSAFIPDPEGGPARVDDDLPERLAEDFVEAATSGEARDNEAADAATPEEVGGPFVTTGPADELAHDVDDSNPPDATREPLPRAMAADSSAGDDPDVDELEEEALRAPSRERK
jgi:hypothetical protein